MDDEYFKIIDLEKHETKDNQDQHVNGSLTVVWRDWDNIIKDELRMIYVSSVNPGEIKGPHLHTKRNSCFVCIHGEVVFVIQKKSKKIYIEKHVKMINSKGPDASTSISTEKLSEMVKRIRMIEKMKI